MRSSFARRRIEGRASREAQDAMVGIRGLYVDAGDVDGYFAYAREAGAPTDVGEAQRDSLTFAAAERIYLSGDAPQAVTALESYVRGDARGQYIPTALSYLSGLYFNAGRYSDAVRKLFGALDGYTDEAFWRQHPIIRFDTRAGFGQYAVLAVFKTTPAAFPYHEFVNAADEAEFDDYVRLCMELSLYDTGIAANYGNKLITLSTCEYTQADGRLVVVGVRI